jgi:hypothetical protein
LKSQIVISKLAIPLQRVERRILLIRGQKVVLDADPALLYGVTTGAFNQAVRRNLQRFPVDFMFQLTDDEADSLRSQIATSKKGRGGRRYNPLAFIEQGVAMLSSVLHSERAVQVNIAIMRAFVKLREILASHSDLARRLQKMEKLYDAQFRVVLDTRRELMRPPLKSRSGIGFRSQGAP